MTLEIAKTSLAKLNQQIKGATDAIDEQQALIATLAVQRDALAGLITTLEAKAAEAAAPVTSH